MKVTACAKLSFQSKAEGRRRVRKDSTSQQEPIIVKKYANRRLYNTDTSTYVTLDDLAEMVRSERDFVVYDAKTQEDLTHCVLTQIIVEQESKGQNLLPIPFLRQLIRFYGDSIERLVPSYLELSLDSLTQQQDKFRTQFADVLTNSPFEAIQEQTRQNMAMFEKALTMFTPFGQAESSEEKEEAAKKPKSAEKSESTDEIAELKAQLSDMQSKLEKLSDS